MLMSAMRPRNVDGQAPWPCCHSQLPPCLLYTDMLSADDCRICALLHCTPRCLTPVLYCVLDTLTLKEAFFVTGDKFCIGSAPAMKIFQKNRNVFIVREDMASSWLPNRPLADHLGAHAAQTAWSLTNSSSGSHSRNLRAHCGSSHDAPIMHWQVGQIIVPYTLRIFHDSLIPDRFWYTPEGININQSWPAA